MHGTMRWTLSLLLAASAVAVAGCAKEIKIGAVISETGAAAVYGKHVKMGIDLAAEEINAQGGFEGKPFVLLYRDDQTNPVLGRQLVTDLIEQEKTEIIIGAVSSTVTLAIAPICEEKGVVLLSPTASAPKISEAGSWIFRNYPSDILEGTAMANFARDLGLERLAIFAVDNEYGEGLSEVFSKKYQSTYYNIVETFRFKEGDTDSFDAMVAKLKDLKPQGVYIVGYLTDVAELVKRIREAGIQALILTSSSVDESLAELIGPAADNVIFPRPAAFDPESEDEKVQRFVRAFREKYGEDPDQYAAYGYDALYLILEAMKKAGGYFGRDVKLGLLAIKDYHGVTGRVAFDENGDVVQIPKIFIIRQGRAVRYDRFLQEGGSLNIPGL